MFLFLYKLSSFSSQILLGSSLLFFRFDAHLFLKLSDFCLLFLFFSLFLFAILFLFLPFTLQPIVLLLVETSLKFLEQSSLLSVSLFLSRMLFALLFSHFLSGNIFYFVVDLTISVFDFLFVLFILSFEIMFDRIVLFGLVHAGCC